MRPLLFFLIALPLFGLVLPLAAMVFETDRYMKEEAGPVVDAFETAYTLLRFPEYWAAGVAEVLILVLRRRLGRACVRDSSCQTGEAQGSLRTAR